MPQDIARSNGQFIRRNLKINAYPSLCQCRWCRCHPETSTQTTVLQVSFDHRRKQLKRAEIARKTHKEREAAIHYEDVKVYTSRCRPDSLPRCGKSRHNQESGGTEMLLQIE